MKVQRLWLLGLIVFAIGAAALHQARAQELVESSVVRGTLGLQFDRHILELRANDPRQPLRVVMEYVPQEQQELDQRSGFALLDAEGLEAYGDGAPVGSVAIAAGDDLPGPDRTLQAIIQTPDRPFFVVIYNDSSIPMNYTLTAENGTFTDAIRGQVIDVYNPPPSAGGEAPVIVVPGTPPTPRPEGTRTPTPPPVRGQTLRGVLTERYDTDWYVLDVLDENQRLTIEMSYDPPGQFMQDKGLEFNVFSPPQFRNLQNNFLIPWRAEDTTESHLFVLPDGRFVWRAEIVEPFYDEYYLSVSQYRYDLQWLRYRLNVTNAVLVDETGEAVPFPAPTPTPEPFTGPTPVPAGEPFIVVTVRPRPSPTPVPGEETQQSGETPTPSDATPAPTPSPTPTVQSPLPTPTSTPQAAAPPSPTTEKETVQAASVPASGSGDPAPASSHTIYLPTMHK